MSEGYANARRCRNRPPLRAAPDVIFARPAELCFTNSVRRGYDLETVYQLYNDRAELWVRNE
jgi:hypothetical protein